MLACVAVAVLCAATVHAADYKMLLCAGNNGSNSFQTATNTAYSKYPSGIFSFENYCGPAPDPAGNNALLRIRDIAADGTAAETAYGSISWTVPPWIAIRAGGGYTREPGAFNEGWRARFWLEGFDGSTNNSLMQGSGVANGSLGGIGWGTTSTFASHIWPFTSFGYFRRFVFEVTCFRPAGCDRSGENTADANTISLILDDTSPVDLQLTNTGAPLYSGQWVRGTQTATYSWSDQGSGIRKEWIEIDPARGFNIDDNCDVGASGPNGEFARVFQPCSTASNIGRSYTFDTAGLADGPHTLEACAQDYGQFQGLYGTGGASCRQATIRTDNSAPGRPASLEVTSANPARYLDHFGAAFSLPPNSGSPIAKVHYYVTDDEDGGKVVMPEKVVSATNPTSLSNIEGPPEAGAYSLHVALEDQVGFLGPYAAAPVPHDTTPPAAPQNLHVLGTTAHRVPKFDIGWNDIADAGSPINTAHDQVIDGSGEIVIPSQVASGDGIEAIRDISTPPQGRDLKVRVWLTDAEGNVGTPATVAVPRDETPPAAPQDLSVASPTSSRASQGFDLRWRNIIDDGSPINAAHYEIVNGSGGVVVPATTVTGDNIERIADLDTPRARGSYTLLLWLSDAEGNTGAPVKAPLSYNCMKADDAGGSSLTAGLGKHETDVAFLHQGEGTTLSGQLGGAQANVPICVFSQVVTEEEREFVGVAITNPTGDYQFAVPAGPSRELTAAYRPGQRELTAQATVRTRVRPTFRLVRKVVRNKSFAIFETAIPGPRKKNVVILLQVKSGKAWRVFRRCHTRGGGRCLLRYRFTQTPSPTVYIMRAQVRAQSGYPYQQGSSKARRLRVVPSTSRARLARG
jgi:hypothetical protein